MTQALLNNLNNFQDNIISFKDNTLNDVENNFDKVLDKTTLATLNNKSEKQVTVENTNFRTIQKEEKSESAVNSDNTTKCNNSTDSEIDKSNCTIFDNSDIEDSNILQEELDSAIKESAIETVIDLTIIKDIYQFDKEIELTDNTKDNSEEEKDSEESTNNPQCNIITEEDSTMYQDLNTLEDSTIALILQPQIQTVSKKVIQENSATSVNENTKTNLNTKSNNNEILTDFKQFEDNLSKDIENINLSSKKTYQEDAKNSDINNKLDAKIVKELNIKSINSESTDNQATSNDDIMQNQTPQEQATKVLIQGDIKLENNSPEVIKTGEVKITDVSPNKIIEQISKQIEKMYNNTKLNIVLNPGSLGRVNLQIVNSKEGIMAQFTVTTQDAKDILMKGLDGLKNSLLSQGINIDNVQVKLEESDNDSSQDWTEQDGSRGGYKHQGSNKQQKENEKPFEQMMFELNNNGKV